MAFNRDEAEKFQSTLPVWGATYYKTQVVDSFGISIHAPRVGSDLGRQYFDNHEDISIHAPRVGSDP